MGSETTNVRCAKNCGGCGGHDPECVRINATPPTPDLDAVREALVALLYDADNPSTSRKLADLLGVEYSVEEQWTGAKAIADALLAAVSRPAEARGEPVAWMVVEDTDCHMSAHLFSETANLSAETHRIANPAHNYAVQPLYTHPAPSGGEAIDRVMQGYADAYPLDVWPETPFTDAQAASVMRRMVPRIREALTAALVRLTWQEGAA